MIEKLKPVLLKIYFLLFRQYLSWILKIQRQHLTAVFFKVYIQTFSLYPDKQLKYNWDLAQAVRCKIFDLFTDDDNEDLDQGEIGKLYEVVISDDWIRTTIKNYFLLESFYYTFGISSEILKEKSDRALELAKTYNSSATPLSKDDIQMLAKTNKAAFKQLQKEMRRLNSDRVQAEKLKLFTPVSITSSHVVFVVSLFSSIFLVSGFLYNKILLGSFDIEVSDFFGISDYIATSVDLLASTLISTGIGIAAFLWGLSGALTADIHAGLFETERKGRDYLILVIVSGSAIYLIGHSYRTGELHDFYLFVLVCFLALAFFERFPGWKYIKNRAAVQAVALSLMFFGINLAFSINEKVDEIEEGDYEGPYALHLKDEYVRYKGYPYVTSNSSYVFLLDESTKSIVVIPKSGVKLFSVN